MSTYQLIEEAHKLLKLTKANDFHYDGIIISSEAIFDYGRGFLGVRIGLSYDKTSCTRRFCISSIDDSGCTFHFPPQDITHWQYGMADLEEYFKNFKEDVEHFLYFQHCGKCPSVDELKQYAISLGAYAEFW